MVGCATNVCLPWNTAFCPRCRRWWVVWALKIQETLRFLQQPSLISRTTTGITHALIHTHSVGDKLIVQYRRIGVDLDPVDGWKWSSAVQVSHLGLQRWVWYWTLSPEFWWSYTTLSNTISVLFCSPYHNSSWDLTAYLYNCTEDPTRTWRC